MNTSTSQICVYGKKCNKFPRCKYAHPHGSIPDCPYMNTPTGCTNTKCPFHHPEGFVHACIFGSNCKNRPNCPYKHPDERGFDCECHPRREAPPPPLPPREPQSTKNKYENVYDENGTLIGIIDNGHFVSFVFEVDPDIQEADNEMDKIMSKIDPDHPNDYIDFDEFESDPDAYPDH